jgi:hypothetical protein
MLRGAALVGQGAIEEAVARIRKGMTLRAGLINEGSREDWCRAVVEGTRLYTNNLFHCRWERSPQLAEAVAVPAL